jgi:hypothetical protein
MTDDTTTEASEDDVTREQMREFLGQLATKRATLKEMSEAIGEDLLPLALQALATEVISTSIKVEQELEERMAGLEVTMKLVGALMGGLMGGGEKLAPETDPEEADPDVELPAFDEGCSPNSAQPHAGRELLSERVRDFRRLAGHHDRPQGSPAPQAGVWRAATEGVDYSRATGGTRQRPRAPHGGGEVVSDDLTEFRIKRLEDAVRDCRQQLAEMLEQLRSRQTPPALRQVPDTTT